MPNQAAAGPKHKGWWNDQINNRLVAVYNGVEIFDFDGNDFAMAQGAVMASGVVSGNLTLSSTLTLGADGVGADGEQATSGGAAAECDWAAAGSMRQFKHLLGIRDDAEEALQMMVETPVYDFRYRSKKEAAPGERITNTGDTKTVYTGIVADEAPWAMHFDGRILNPINALGYTILAIKALNAKIASLETQLAAQA